MSRVEELQPNLASLAAERARLLKEGWILQNCWLVQVKPGGTARTSRQYWQVRSKQAMFDGKKLKHVKSIEVEDYQAAITRGKQLRQIERRIEELRRLI